MEENIMKFLASIAFLFIFCTTSPAAIFVSVQSGNWTDVNTWEQDGVAPASRTPAQGDTVIISAGDVLEVTANLDFRTGAAMYIQVAGTLEFPNGGARLRLAAGSGVKVLPGGQVLPSGPGGGSSRVIEIGGTTVWRAGDGTLPGPSDLGTTPPIPLPVTWVGVWIDQYQGFANVHWQISDEINNHYFEVWRSRDLETFIQIAHVEANRNALYLFRDKSPLIGESYYKIKQVDQNGAYSFSKAVSFFYLSDSDIQIYPNPVSDQLHIKGFPDTETLHVSVLDMMGREQKIHVSDTAPDILIAVENLRSGSYILLIKGDHLTRSYRFNKL